jgi:hypothetical protein
MHTNANKLFLIIFPSIRKKFKNIFVDSSRKNFNKQRQALDLPLIQKKHTKRLFFNQLIDGNYPGAAIFLSEILLKSIFLIANRSLYA